MRPLARRDGLVLRDLADETLVYDRERHQAHCLNPTAAAVFRLCDGERSTQDIAGLLAEPADQQLREAIVGDALGQLAAARLLVTAPDAPPAPAAFVAPATPAPTEASGPSRRELLRRVGTALLVPAITSIVAPTPAQAASACYTNSQCFDSANWCKPCEFGCDGSYVCDNAGANQCVERISTTCP